MASRTLTSFVCVFNPPTMRNLIFCIMIVCHHASQWLPSPTVTTRTLSASGAVVSCRVHYSPVRAELTEEKSESESEQLSALQCNYVGAHDPFDFPGAFG